MNRLRSARSRTSRRRCTCAVGDVLQPRAKAVDDHHVVQRLVAEIVEAEGEVDHVARLGEAVEATFTSCSFGRPGGSLTV